MKTGIELIADERHRQIAKEGFSQQHDEEHDAGELSAAGAAYALNASCVLYPLNGTPLEDTPIMWPWEPSWWKPKDPLADLVRAGALIAAEIDKLLRAKTES